MITEGALRRKFEARRPSLEAWGCEIVRIVMERFQGRKSLVGTAFWAVPPDLRVKATDSFITKALYKQRSETVGYTDPLNQITDQVGARFVTLLQEDADEVAAFIEAHDGWRVERDRNFREFIHKNPMVFDYFATHLLVRNVKELGLGGVTVPAGTCCEVQTRTLLQHAHSELMHNTTYKGQLRENVEVVRKVARGAAMIEGTDEIFATVAGRIQELTRPMEELSSGLRAYYDRKVKVASVDGPLNHLMMDRLTDNLHASVNLPTIEKYFDTKPNLLRVVRDRASDTAYYQTPAVLLAIYLVENRPRHLQSRWPLTESELNQLIASVGSSSGF